jgi:hypothetical protein
MKAYVCRVQFSHGDDNDRSLRYGALTANEYEAQEHIRRHCKDHGVEITILDTKEATPGEAASLNLSVGQVKCSRNSQSLFAAI